jgi:hypothetical protein
MQAYAAILDRAPDLAPPALAIFPVFASVLLLCFVDQLIGVSSPVLRTM